MQINYYLLKHSLYPYKNEKFLEIIKSLPEQDWKNPLVRSPRRVPYAVGRVEILAVSNVNY